MSLRVIRQSLAVVAMTVAAVLVVRELDAWLGDLGALLWICACFFFPFLIGIALGGSAMGKPGRVAGALIGGGIALVPVVAFAFAEFRTLGPGLADVPWALLVVFPLLGMAQGAISMPVGGSARRRRQPA